MSKTRDPIEYLLNAMENAAQSKNPGKAGYAAKRRAVLDAIADLRLSNDALVEINRSLRERLLRVVAIANDEE